MHRWTDARWLAGVDFEQRHVRPWSTVLRVPTTGGDVWFEANVPLRRYEAAVGEAPPRGPSSGRPSTSPSASAGSAGR